MRSSCRQQEHSILRIQATKAARRKLILQVAQDFIMITVDGQRDKYVSAKVILETAQLVYIWITRDQVYSNMRLLKQIFRYNEALYHGSPSPAGGAQPEGPQPVMI